MEHKKRVVIAPHSYMLLIFFFFCFNLCVQFFLTIGFIVVNLRLFSIGSSRWSIRRNCEIVQVTALGRNNY